MGKIKLHQKAAEMLDEMKAQGLDDQAIILRVLDESAANNGKVLGGHAKFSNVIQALANGWEAKDSPEDAIRAFYYGGLSMHSDGLAEDDEVTLARGDYRIEAVEFVLDQLGIVIEGVNDKDAN